MGNQKEGAKGCDMLYSRAMELLAMTLGPACERPVPDTEVQSLVAPRCPFTIRKRIAYWMITKR